MRKFIFFSCIIKYMNKINLDKIIFCKADRN